MTREEVIKIVKEALLEFDKDAEIILYGSRARGDNQEDSDWDFLILLKKTVNESIKDKIRERLFDIELETEFAFSTIIHSRQDWIDLSITPLFDNIQREGVRK
jgi:uncharacterized protein